MFKIFNILKYLYSINFLKGYVNKQFKVNFVDVVGFICFMFLIFFSQIKAASWLCEVIS